MKKMFVVAVLLALTTSVNIHGNQTFNSNGFQKYGKESLGSVQSNGTVLLEGTNVSGLVEVNGSLKAENSEINSLRVNGQVNLQNCVIKNAAVIGGSLEAENTKFQNDLFVASQKIVLRMCTVESLTIRKVSGFTGKQIVDLRDGTHVKGPIVIESKNGEIWISANSEISESQVNGAQVFRK